MDKIVIKFSGDRVWIPEHERHGVKIRGYWRTKRGKRTNVSYGEMKRAEPKKAEKKPINAPKTIKKPAEGKSIKTENKLFPDVKERLKTVQDKGKAVKKAEREFKKATYSKSTVEIKYRLEKLRKATDKYEGDKKSVINDISEGIKTIEKIANESKGSFALWAWKTVASAEKLKKAVIDGKKISTNIGRQHPAEYIIPIMANVNKIIKGNAEYKSKQNKPEVIVKKPEKIEYSAELIAKFESGELTKQDEINHEKEHKALYERIRKMFEEKGEKFNITLDEFAGVIAKEHTDEDPEYYKKLEEIEGV